MATKTKPKSRSTRTKPTRRRATVNQVPTEVTESPLDVRHAAVPEAPDAGDQDPRHQEAPESRDRAGRHAEAPDAGDGRVSHVEGEFTHGRSQS
jgi:hypothetical protein